MEGNNEEKPMEGVEASQPEVTAEQQAALDESMALAQKMQEEDDLKEATAQIDAQDNIGSAEEEKKEPQGEPISTYVKQDLVKQIMEMGFGQHAAEKALFMTMSKGQSVESAMDWINENMEAPDFNEQLFMVGKSEDAELKKAYAGNLSKEERIALAEAKIKAKREEREKESKVSAHEMEISRIANTKAMQAAKREHDEQQKEKDMWLRKKEKEEFMNEKLKMQIQLERDRCERAGIPFDEKKAFANVKKKEVKPPLEQIKHGIKTIKTLYTEDRQPGVAKTAFKTLNAYTGNVVKNPTDPKFLSINMSNEAFQKRVGKISGGKIVLIGFGFEEDTGENKLVLKKYDAELFTKGLELLKYELM